MHYSNGKAIKIGDRVRLGNGEKGEVVFSVDTNEFSADFPVAHWSYLKTGIMVKTDAGALVHFKHVDAGDVELL